VDSNVVRHYDEHVDSWLRRINQQAMRSAALAAGLELGENSVFDAEEMVKISQKIIEQAYARGQLRDCGPRLAVRSAAQARRLSRLCLRAAIGSAWRACASRLEKGANIEQRIRTVDEERAKYLQQYFGKSWCNPHLYDLMISLAPDEDSTRGRFCYAMTGRRKIRGQGSHPCGQNKDAARRPSAWLSPLIYSLISDPDSLFLLRYIPVEAQPGNQLVQLVHGGFLLLLQIRGLLARGLQLSSARFSSSTKRLAASLPLSAVRLSRSRASSAAAVSSVFFDSSMR
jgi:hypothetical protein